MGMDPLVAAALIAAIPATVAAWNSVITSRRTATANGRRLGQVVEDNSALLEELNKKVDQHILDSTIHHKLVKNDQ